MTKPNFVSSKRTTATTAPPKADRGLTGQLGTIRYIRKNPNPSSSNGTTLSMTALGPDAVEIQLPNTVEPSQSRAQPRSSYPCTIQNSITQHSPSKNRI